MFVFGHLGVGRRLFQHQTRNLSVGYFWLGALLPDLIDKALYYPLQALTQLPGTRSFGHTGLLFLFLLATTRKTGSARLRALSLGVGSHLILDFVADLFTHFPEIHPWSDLPVFWPLTGSFPLAHHPSLSHHLRHAKKPFYLITELLGLIFFIRDAHPFLKQAQAFFRAKIREVLRKSKSGQSGGG